MRPNSLLGTWRLKSYLVMTAAGERLTPYGENPAGYLSYGADGRMHVIGTAGERIRCTAVALTAERAALYDTMFAYAGTYSIEGDRILHHVDISWNETWTGTDQMRLFELDGHTLTLTMDAVDPARGTQARYVAVWEKLQT